MGNDQGREDPVADAPFEEGDNLSSSEVAESDEPSNGSGSGPDLGADGGLDEPEVGEGYPSDPEDLKGESGGRRPGVAPFEKKSGAASSDAIAAGLVDKQVRTPFSWGWLVALLSAILLVGGGFGFYALSNGLAHSWWGNHLNLGDTVAVLTIPALGDDKIPVLEGTSLETLRQGAGWYEGTALPGELGNFVVAGYRLGWGEPFADIGQLRIGDTITVATGSATYTYVVVTLPTVVADDDASVLDAVPGGPGLAPTRALLTLTTAASLLPSPERLVVVAELATG
ncbi:MAG: sortase [Propionibacteriaceae bacterium]|jgi:sortase A|nr:sortase [Propionibacteriaceae bacterium]